MTEPSAPARTPLLTAPSIVIWLVVCSDHDTTSTVAIDATGELAPTDIEAAEYPGVPTDLQAPFSAYLATIKGVSTMRDTIYPDRFTHVEELARTGADLRPDGGIDDIEVLPNGSTRWRWRGHQVSLPIPGRFNVRNALLALGVAVELGVEEEVAVRGLSGVTSARLRGEWHQIGELRVLADCYNSNPPSVRGAVDLIATLPADGDKVVVLGTMREMGERAAELHREVAEDVVARLGDGIDQVVATGAFVNAFEAAAPDDPRIIRWADPLAAYERLAGRLHGTETILLKASRGEALERWLPLLREEWE